MGGQEWRKRLIEKNTQNDAAPQRLYQARRNGKAKKRSTAQPRRGNGPAVRRSKYRRSKAKKKRGLPQVPQPGVKSMPWKIEVELLYLAPFALLWLGALAYEAARVVAGMRETE
jgi:hypothetical protein